MDRGAVVFASDKAKGFCRFSGPTAPPYDAVESNVSGSDRSQDWVANDPLSARANASLDSALVDCHLKPRLLPMAGGRQAKESILRARRATGQLSDCNDPPND